MTPDQAFQFLRQVLVTKQGLSVQDCANVVQAWNLVAAALAPKPPAPPPDRSASEPEA